MTGPSKNISSTVLPATEASSSRKVSLAIVGAGACGMTAALAAKEAGVTATLFERDSTPSGSTALSTGLIPAAGTRFQKAENIDDTPGRLIADVMAKNGGMADPELVDTVCHAAGPTLEWLADRHDVPLEVADGFLYPGHTQRRMHATPKRTGADLMAYLRAAVDRSGIDIVTNARVTTLFTGADRRITAIGICRADGAREDIGCAALVLACNGYGGNAALVRHHCPDIVDGVFIGHAGNTGDAVYWGEALGAALRDLDAYQAHGAVTCGKNSVISWALMSEGGIQVNAEGLRFSNEHEGVSEQATRVLAQPGGVAWCIHDERLHRLGLDFAPYRDAVANGEVVIADTTSALADATGLPVGPLTATLDGARRCAHGEARDPLGRDFTTNIPLEAPYYAAKVTGALFHTQGGLAINTDGRVLDERGAPFPNLFAGGGAARGISGSGAGGYLPGNGLLTAIALGRICGTNAARLAAAEAP